MSTGPNAADLEAKKSAMKKVTVTDKSGQLDPAAVAAMEKLYNDNGGDLAKITAATGIKFKHGLVVKDANHFAKGMLQGGLADD